MANKKIVYSENVRAIVGALKGTDGMTFNQLREATGLDLKTGHLTNAKSLGLIDVVGQAEVIREGKKHVNTYLLLTKEAQPKADGKMKEYSDRENAILEVLGNAAEPMTLAAIGEALGAPISSGSINSLVKFGNVGKGEQVEIIAPRKSKVNVYGFVKDIPTEE